MLFEIYRQFQGQVSPSRIANDDDVLWLNTLIQDILICCWKNSSSLPCGIFSGFKVSLIRNIALPSQSKFFARFIGFLHGRRGTDGSRCQSRSADDGSGIPHIGMRVELAEASHIHIKRGNPRAHQSDGR